MTVNEVPSGARPTMTLKEAAKARDQGQLEAHLQWSTAAETGGVPDANTQPKEGDAWMGYCLLCQKRTVFHMEGPLVRNHLKCTRCNMIPRRRMFVWVLNRFIPAWREMRIHESSPSGPLTAILKRQCPHYLATHYYAGIPGGTIHKGFRCEDLEKQTFADGSLDLVFTQDVFEHIFDAGKAFGEIARTLRPGGAHVFTVPWYLSKPTKVCAEMRDGKIEHLVPPSYHGNPIDPDGSLVVREWGWDLCEFIYKHSGMFTTPFAVTDWSQGMSLAGGAVFISDKAGGESVRAPWAV